ncbi:MAG: hypothetical protein LBG96_14490 [Tannerella sp.]|jgi:predicted AAA+ superfamily ATPase|nr:hypothetical protein [Tannerella sp.]
MIHRILENTVRDKLNTGKAIILTGAGQVGKTTLVKELFKGSSVVSPDNMEEFLL